MKGDVMSWKQVFVAYLKILSHDSPPDSEKNNRNFSPDSSQVGYVRTWHRNSKALPLHHPARLTRHRARWSAVVKTVMNILTAYKAGDALIN
jgi:hypothetical protein